jgi:16S rRNA (cytosine967-C5)-methyltransferase
LQVQILTNVAKLLAPGGTLLYAVCSVLRAECEDVVDQVIAADPSLTLSAWPVPPAPGVAPGACTARLLPHVHGTDGYFVARIARA